MAEKSVSDNATENILSIFDVSVLICQVTHKMTKNHKILLPHLSLRPGVANKLKNERPLLLNY